MRTEFWDGAALMRRLYNQSMEPVCCQTGLTRTEMDVLLFLANNPEFDTARDIVEQRMLTKSHVSASVSTLEERGYLERNYRPGNRRTVHLRLLPASAPAVEAGRHAQERFFKAAFRGISPEEIQRMSAVFSKITTNVREILWEE